MILPNIISTGLIGIESRLSMVPRSVSRVTESAVKISMVMVRMVPTSPGTMFSRDAAAGLYRAWARISNGIDGGSPVKRSCCERGLHQGAERAEPRARRDRIGRIGRDQQRRTIAATNRALEAARDFDAEQHLARLQEIVELGDIVHLIGEAEIGAVLQRLEDRAPEIAVLLQQHRGRQIMRRGIDGVAE